MNHLGRRTNVAKALYRGLLIEMLDHGKMVTTLAKAKSIQGELDGIINWAKQGTVNARRQTIKAICTDKFFDKYAKSFPNRNSGYSRIIRLGQRFSDTAEMVSMELVEKVMEGEVIAPKVEAKAEPVVEEKVEVKEVKKVKKVAKKKDVKDN